MQTITKQEIEWIVAELHNKIKDIESYMQDCGPVGKSLMELRRDNYRNLADKLAAAALTGDKQIRIKR